MKIKEVCERLKISKQGIYKAIKEGRLICKKDISGRFVFTEEGLDYYSENKYNRQKNSTYNGEKTWDPEKGEYSINQAKEILGLNNQQVYYFVRIGYLKTKKKGYHIVIDQKDLQKVLKHLEERRKKSGVVEETFHEKAV